MNQPRFNYIITIHNKEDLIEQVITAVLMCCRDNSHIYAVLDGCTDHTEEIIDNLLTTYSGVPISKIKTMDVHELLSINAGLRAAPQEGLGFNIILQDDVVLADYFLEKKVSSLYEWVGSKLGYLSFRMGANFARDAATSNSAVPFVDYIENVYGHGISSETLIPGFFTYRSVPIKSPVCIPFHIVREVGLLEERLAPYGHDDPQYAIRVINAGYQNGVFAIRFFSDIKWGGTRTNPHPELNHVIIRNMDLIRTWHSQDLAHIAKNPPEKKLYEVPDMVDQDEVNMGTEMLSINRQRLEKYYGKSSGSWVSRFSNVLRKVRNLKHHG